MVESLKSFPPEPLFPGRTPYEFAHDDPRRLQRLSVENQKKRAKTLLRQWRDGDPEAIIRAEKHLSPRSLARLDQLKLSDAQHVIAREYQFGNWPAFKAYMEHSRIEQEAIDGGGPPALDQDRTTLHIRCGNDIQHALTVAGFCGDFMSFADPYVQGPVPKIVDRKAFIQVRAEFLNQAHYAKDATAALTREYDDLDTASGYDRVMLWFEHDSHDILILARLLDYFCEPVRRPRTLHYIIVTHYPGVKRFNGLGHLPPEAMRVLWYQFEPVTDQHLHMGRAVWRAVTAPEPVALYKLIQAGTEPMPAMAKALERHLRELPSTVNGLSLTEQLVLQVLGDYGPASAIRLFGWYTNRYEPLTFMGDSGFWNVLDALADAHHPAIVLDKQGDHPKDWHVDLTATGKMLWAGEADWAVLNGLNRWVGGVHLNADQGFLWRYDDERGPVKTNL